MTVKNKLVACALLLASPSCWAEAQSFAMDHASVDVASCQDVAVKERMFSCHRIERGTGYVVATRQYWPPRRSDDDAFEKVTVVFQSKPNRGDKLDVARNGVAVFFSAGPSSFPGNHGCYGAARDGVVDVVSVSESAIRVLVSATIDVQSPLGFQGECQPKKMLKREITARVARVDDLTTWRGRKDGSPDAWDEAHP
ncbi:hypothetical protein KPL74_05395 [Bacillus sp. NP157]|nr:hypothetical protein KPL74_05395 [Bacillus sp. NP157]